MTEEASAKEEFKRILKEIADPGDSRSPISGSERIAAGLILAQLDGWRPSGDDMNIYGLIREAKPLGHQENK